MPEEITGVAQLDDVRLVYGRAGTGPAQIFIHAGIADRRMWDTQIGPFSKEFTTVRFDMRGFGESEMVDKPFSFCGDLSGLIDALELGTVFLVACSMGAAVALQMAIEEPERVAGLVLVGAGTPGVVPDDGYYEPPESEEAEAAFKAGDLDRAAEVEVQIWIGGYGRSIDDVPATVRDAVFDMNRIAVETEDRRGEHEQRPEPGVGTRLDEVRCPTLVVVGERDLPDLIWSAEYLAANIGDATHVTIPDAAHLPNMEHPELFNQTVLDFLRANA
jgi:pimeloyl-ACP methyl ester carboxylesterase